MKESDLAWLAGIWDGEGSVFMTSQNKRHMVPHISMDNTDPYIIAKVVQLFEQLGINIHVNESWKKGSTKLVYRVATAKCEYIKIFAEKVGPYLKGEKKAKLELLNKFVSSRLNRKKTDKYNEEESEIFLKFRSSETTREAAQSG